MKIDKGKASNRPAKLLMRFDYAWLPETLSHLATFPKNASIDNNTMLYAISIYLTWIFTLEQALRNKEIPDTRDVLQFLFDADPYLRAMFIYEICCFCCMAGLPAGNFTNHLDQSKLDFTSIPNIRDEITTRTYDFWNKKRDTIPKAEQLPSLIKEAQKSAKSIFSEIVSVVRARQAKIKIRIKESEFQNALRALAAIGPESIEAKEARQNIRISSAYSFRSLENQHKAVSIALLTNVIARAAQSKLAAEFKCIQVPVVNDIAVMSISGQKHKCVLSYFYYWLMLLLDKGLPSVPTADGKYAVIKPLLARYSFEKSRDAVDLEGFWKAYSKKRFSSDEEFALKEVFCHRYLPMIDRYLERPDLAPKLPRSFGLGWINWANTYAK